MNTHEGFQHRQAVIIFKTNRNKKGRLEPVSFEYLHWTHILTEH